MVKNRYFEVLLQQQIKVDDECWDFSVSEPPPAITRRKSIKSISFMSSPSKQEITLRLETSPSNRMICNEPVDRVLLVSFANFKLCETNENGNVAIAPMRDSVNYITKVLKTGITVNGITYHFFGHSNSQLKSRSCFMYAGSKEEISAKIESHGDFSKIKSVGKKAKRIGLLFSTAEMETSLSPERYEDIPDVVHGGYTFTDGCGLISSKFAKLLVKRKNIIFENRPYLPSVYQIRYRGYKGVLALCPAMRGAVDVQFRDSMRKFKDAKDLSFSVVDYSKPYAFGFLNDEHVLLLHALGISTSTLICKQEEYFSLLRSVLQGHVVAAFQFLSYLAESSLAEQLLINGIQAVQSSLRRLVKTEYSKMLNKTGGQRCRIMILRSRLLFGICDPSRKLAAKTCFVRITEDGSGQARTLINTEVLVTRNPCLHPGDIQKFKTVDIPEFSHLVDCIVFPTCGKRPSADMMSGGDLDGDKFFVSWDSDIMPRELSEPALYPAGKERISFGTMTNDDRAEYFANYNNASLGKVKNLHIKWARLKGAMSPECQELNRLFSQCVDGNRIKIRSDLEDPPEPGSNQPTFVLDEMHRAAEATIDTGSAQSSDILDYPVEMMDLLTTRDNIAFSEFELIQMVLRKCERDSQMFSEYSSCFNYSTLTDEQKSWLLSSLPPSLYMPNLVKNGLLQSSLVGIKELQRFQLHCHNLHWKPIFKSDVDRMGRFLSTISRCFELFHKKLVILRADERLTLMIYVPQKVAKASEIRVDSSVRVFALPHSSGTDSVKYHVMPTKTNYKLYCDDGVFQLYNEKRSDTFIFMVNGAQNDSSFRNIQSVGDRRRQQQAAVEDGTNFHCRASIALNKISGPVQKHVGRMNRAGILAAEVYCISNRDVESMRYLDEWLSYVDTEKVLPLFAPEIPHYQIPSLRDYDAGQFSDRVVSIVWRQDFSGLFDMEDVEELQQFLALLNDTRQKAQLRLVYEQLLQPNTERQARISGSVILRTLLQFLPHACFLTQRFLDSALWRSERTSVEDVALEILPVVLKELVLNANSFPAFVCQPFLSVMKELPRLSLKQISELVELVALSVDSPEVALNLFLDCMQPQVLRLSTEANYETDQFTRRLMAVALDHIDQAQNIDKSSEETLALNNHSTTDGYEVVKTNLRIDSGGQLPQVGDHIQFYATSSPMSAPLDPVYQMNTLVLRMEQGSMICRCLQHPPSFLTSCSWRYRNCGSFVTSKAMIDAVVKFYTLKTASCRLYKEIIGEKIDNELQTSRDISKSASSILNESQSRAVSAALQSPLTFLWGPPGTGKTHTILVLLHQMLDKFSNCRFLITAPTNNAVDNILRRLMKDFSDRISCFKPLRVSTSLDKVSTDLVRYTCDAMVGKDLSEGHEGRKKAQKRIKESKMIFTTSVGAGLGLLRSEEFDIVFIDEASQQTEPEALIPLSKGCQRAILVGDHVQLRPTVNIHADIFDFGMSLFERQYDIPAPPGTAKVMLDTQYRMHSDICSFSSREFYDNQLHTAAEITNRPLSPSQFPWPDNARKVFIQCDGSEDLGNRSKVNATQAQTCQLVWRLLMSSTESDLVTGVSGTKSMADVVVLTPYSRQREVLKEMIPDIKVSTIDGYQGREADIVIFVTVRSNAHHELGFLNDERRLNVAMTRARAGIIVIGDRKTLLGQGSQSNEKSKGVWKRLLDECVCVQLCSYNTSTQIRNV